MSKDKNAQSIVSSDKNVAAQSLLSLHDNKIKDYEKQEIDTNIYFEELMMMLDGTVGHCRLKGDVTKLMCFLCCYRNFACLWVTID